MSSADLKLAPHQAKHLDRICELAAAAERTGQGSVVFLVGASGSGKTHLLRHAAGSLPSEVPGARVVTGGAVDGRYMPAEDSAEEERFASALSSFFSNLSEVPIPLLSPALKALAQILELSVAARELLSQMKSEAEEVELVNLFEPLLGAAARESAEGPLVCLVDDADWLLGDWWLNLQFSLAKIIAVELPLVLVLAIDSPGEAECLTEPGFSGCQVAESLAARGLADICSLEPLGADALGTWIGPMSPSLATKMVEATGGYVGDCADLWQDLRNQGLIEQGNLGWSLIGRGHIGLDYGAKRFAQRLTEALGPLDSAGAEELRRALFCAAQEGNVFTAEAVAAACDRDPDELIDTLDELSEDGDHDPMLRELGAVWIQDPVRRISRHVWRYGFARSIDWRVARERLGDRFDRPGASGRLADELAILYGPERRLVAHVIAGLLRRADRADDAGSYERLAWLRVSAGVLNSFCRQVASSDTQDWTAFDFHAAANVLLGGCAELWQRWSLPEASAYAKKAEVFALEAQTLGTTDLAHALCFRAYFARMAGDFAESRHCAEAAVERSRSGRKEILDSALRELGALKRHQPDRDLRAARDHLEEAIEIFGSIGSRVGQATCLTEIAEVDHLAGDFQSALARNAEALEIEEGEGRADAVASALQRRACIAMDLGQADVVRDILVGLLPFRRERGELGEEANCLGLLAIAEQSLGRVDAARAQLLAAVELQERIGRTTSTVESLFALGELEAKAKHNPEARGYYERAEACYRSMGYVAAAEECRRRLEEL